jgi:hypothetical protein
MDNKEKLQWNIIEKAKNALMKWSKDNLANIHAIRFVSMFDFSLEVYIFYKYNSDITKNEINGLTDNAKQYFLKTISDMDYMKHFESNIAFIFDSDENVIKNYNGSYFLRLR